MQASAIDDGKAREAAPPAAAASDAAPAAALPPAAPNALAAPVAPVGSVVSVGSVGSVGPVIVRVAAQLDRLTADAMLADLDAALATRPARLSLDLAAVEAFDSAGLGGVVEALRRSREHGLELRLRGLSAPMLDFFSLLSIERLMAPRPAPVRLDPISRVGALVEPLLAQAGAVAGVAGDVLRSLLVEPFRGRGKGWRLDRAVLELDHAANGALPIVSLISFLLGLILAMQAYVQLRVWGAEIYIADMVSVSVVTEIGPLMTAIILAARSGSSNAAQIGSMVVSEEVDALQQMGIHPIRFLVVPKVLALGVSVVALGLLFDVVAMSGGALFGKLVAGIELGAYQEQARQALSLSELWVATGKSLVFGVCIGVVGCALGLRVEGGSEGVGRATTNAVVFSIFLIIVIDAVFVTAQRMLMP